MNDSSCNTRRVQGWKRGPIHLLAAASFLLCSAFGAQARAATVATDKADYSPGTTVVISGSGWQPGETVTLLLQEDPPIDADLTLSAVADDNGDFVSTDFAVDAYDIGVAFTLTASGEMSGLMAETTFSDSSLVCPGGFDPDPTCIIAGVTNACVWGCRHKSTPSDNNRDCHINATNPAPADTTCADDGNVCTLDQCGVDADGNGICTHPAGNAGTECRASAGECDPHEVCDGTNAACPADDKSSNGTPCTDDGSICTLDQCDGTSAACQHPAGNAGTECRASAGECDPHEVCDGANTACPTDDKSSNGTPCSDDGSICTLDQCDGSSAACQHPAGNSGTECRASAGECDPHEVCDGANTACPGDQKAGSGTACSSDNNPCTLDQCNGTSAACQHPAGNAGTVCRAAANECDLTESCNGTSSTCPSNAVKSAGVACSTDNISCTYDACNGSTSAPQCIHAPDNSKCSDGNVCTDDACNPTASGANPTTGCAHTVDLIPNGCVASVTNSSLCPFDVDPDLSTPVLDQFRLIYTPDQNNPAAWKMNASNPGQFYYNVFYAGSGNTTLNITLPYPFVTQGAVPIHIYNSVSSINDGCFVPGTEIANSSTKVLLANYNAQQFGSTQTVSVTLPNLPAGFAYINMHLDYGLKGTTNYSKDASNNAIDATSLVVRIPDKQNYTFSDSLLDTDTVQSENVFKRDPGIGGLVLNSQGNPVANVQVQIYDPSNKLQATVYTDQDGWYMWQYKYTGKAATFTVKLPAYNLSTAVTLKSNSFLVVTFTVP